MYLLIISAWGLMTWASPHFSPSMDSVLSPGYWAVLLQGHRHWGSLLALELQESQSSAEAGRVKLRGIISIWEGSVLRHLPRTHLTDSPLSRLSFENKPRWIFSSSCENLILVNKEQHNQKYLMLVQAIFRCFAPSTLWVNYLTSCSFQTSKLPILTKLLGETFSTKQ